MYLVYLLFAWNYVYAFGKNARVLYVREILMHLLDVKTIVL